MTIKVLVVDDSAVVRKVVSEILDADPSIDVIAKASDPIFAMKHMEKAWPDVILLDIEMPRMDGITFLKKIMSERPTPVVICSSMTQQGADITMQALASGAVDIIAKPKVSLSTYFREERTLFLQAIKSAAQANIKQLKPNVIPIDRPVPAKHSVDTVIPPVALNTKVKTDCVVAIGTSTGGTQALEEILSSLPSMSPGIVIVQHMPEKFTRAFATRLNGLCEIEVKEAENLEVVTPGKALIAPGGKHMMLKRNGTRYFIEIIDGPLVNRHRPSVDVLFRSAAASAGKNALGIIMTGMGDDGAKGLLEMKNSGAHTLAQDKDSCVVYGMPKEAVNLGAVCESISLRRIPEAIVNYICKYKLG